MNLEAVYPNPAKPSEEMSFDELRAAHRGWADKDWRQESMRTLQAILGNAQRSHPALTDAVMDKLSRELEQKRLIDGNESSEQSTPLEHSQNHSQDDKPTKSKKVKVREVRQETQTGQSSQRFFVDIERLLTSCQSRQTCPLQLVPRSDGKSQQSQQ